MNSALATAPCHSLRIATPFTMPKQSASHFWSRQHDITTQATHGSRVVTQVSSRVTTLNRLLVLGTGDMALSSDIWNASGSYSQLPRQPGLILECTQSNKRHAYVLQKAGLSASQRETYMEAWGCLYNTWVINRCYFDSVSVFNSCTTRQQQVSVYRFLCDCL